MVGLNYSPEPTGIAPYTSGLAEALTRSGYLVRVISGYPHYPQWRVHDGYTGITLRQRVRGVDVTRLRSFVPTKPRLLDRLAMEVSFGLRAVLAKWGRPDVVVLVSPALFSTGLAALWARLRAIPSCIWVQDIYSLGVSESGTGGRLASWILRRLERSILRSANSVVVIHERFERFLVEELGIAAERVTVVRNWSHLGDSEPVSRAAARASRGWSPEQIIVLHAGNMGAKQNLENVVSAAELAAEENSSVRFVLLGDGNQRVALQALGASSHLEFLEPLPDDEFAAALAAADVLLVNERPGLTEMSVPSKLTSYFSTGLPVLAATDALSITAEELARAGAGVRVDAAEPAALLHAAEELGTDSERAAAYGSAGRAYLADNLTEESSVRRFLGVIAPLARRGRLRQRVRIVRNATGGAPV